MDVEKRVKLVEEAILTMRDLLLRYDERVDEIENKSRKDKEDFDFKLNALIDSQIRNETEITEIKESIIELRKLSESTIRRVENLENKN